MSTLASMNIWADLYDEDSAQKAQNVLAAAFGAATDPSVLISELVKVTEWLMPLKPNGQVDADEAAQRLLHFIAALTMLGRQAIDTFATTVVEVQLDLEDDAEVPDEPVRNVAFELLGQYADRLREIANEGEDEAL